MAREILRSGAAVIQGGLPTINTQPPQARAPSRTEKRPGKWLAMDEAPRDGREIWLAGAGVVHKGRWDEDGGFWQDLFMTGTSPTPRPCLFVPVAWAAVEYE